MDQQPPVSPPHLPNGAPVPAALHLTHEQMAQYAAALQRGKKIQRAALVGKIDGSISAVLAGSTLLCVFFGVENLIIGAGLAWLAFRAFRGARMIHQLNPRGPVVLAVNQLILAAIVVLYFSYALWQLSQGKSGLVGMISPTDKAELDELKSAGFSFDDLAHQITSAVRWAYVAAMFLTVIFQGLAARYYYGRKALIETYLRETPKWITDLQSLSAGKAAPMPPPPGPSAGVKP